MSFDDDDMIEIPCEFCGELYPLELITEHQSIHVYYGHETFDENPFIPAIEGNDLIIPEVPEAATVNIESVDEEEQIQLNLVNELIRAEEEAKLNLPHAVPIKENIPAEPPKPVNMLAESKPEVRAKSAEASNKTVENPYKNLHSQVIEEITTKSGEKLLVYGADIESVEDQENEKNNYKMPNNPLLNAIPKEEDVEDINNLSDDDSEETLEEFWKRARDYLKRNRVKI